jgi:NAD(P)-dependent dehydrogenase (short-subunit alcohol dehydrogenase family)
VIDLRDRTVIVTGGTRGLGLAVARAFAETRATVIVTHRWGSADESELRASFERDGLAPPQIVEADASDPEATRALMAEVAGIGHPLHAVVSNVAMAKLVHGIDDLKKRSLDLSVGYSAWPVVDLVQASHAVLGAYPRYVVAVSSDADRWCHPGYDLVGASKAVLECLCRYLAVRLRDEGVRVNAIAPGLIDSAALADTFGEALVDQLRSRGMMLDPARVARVCVALASGWMDAVNGQTLIVDEGWSRVSPLTLLAPDAP